MHDILASSEGTILEYNFNKLDDDFITLWARFILGRQEAALTKQIESLAELGQINAIQSWYVIKPKDLRNKKIDNTVSKLEAASNESRFNISANDYLAIGHYYASWNDMKSCKKYIKSAIELFGKQGTRDVYFAQRYLELIFAYGEGTAYKEDIIDGIGDIKDYSKLIRQVRQTLIRRYKEGDKSSQLIFALSKNIVLYRNIIHTKAKIFDKGLELLKNLADRPLFFIKEDNLKTPNSNSLKEM